jgi:hypothetical protein
MGEEARVLDRMIITTIALYVVSHLQSTISQEKVEERSAGGPRCLEDNLGCLFSAGRLTVCCHGRRADQ